jgi:hypothetical protein
MSGRSESREKIVVVVEVDSKYFLVCGKEIKLNYIENI